MKVGIIRCMQTEDFCPGTNDFKWWLRKKGRLKVWTSPLRLSALSTAAAVRPKIGTAGAGSGKTGRGYHRFCLLHHQGQSHWLSMSFCR